MSSTNGIKHISMDDLKRGVLVYSYPYKSLGRVYEILFMTHNSINEDWAWIDVYLFEYSESRIHDLEDIVLYDDLSSLQKILFGVLLEGDEE